MTPLFKKGNQSKAANCRPVSLTACCCKVMEHVVHSHLMKFLESDKILSDFQHGFRKRRSCETQLITTIHDFAVGLDRRQQVDANLLGFTSSSGSITMASETRAYPGSSFLADRNQQVVLDGKTSSPAAVTCEVPQGRVLEPLLFLVYINDLPTRDSSSVRLFVGVFCTELLKTRRMQIHYKQISITYSNGKEIGRWYLTQTSANISGSPTSEMSFKFDTTFTDRL